jgi:hypothetical protein
MHFFKSALAVSAFVTATALAFVTGAGAVTFNSTDNGQYSNAGSHAPGNTGILAGDIGVSQHRNWFLFDLSTAAGSTVVSAELRVSTATGSYLTNPGTTSLTYAVNDYTGSTAALAAGTAGVAGYTDLGNGAYGQTVLNIPSSGPGTMLSTTFPATTLTVTLNASAIADLNALLAGAVFNFAVGGACSTCGSNESLWRSQNGVPTGFLDLEFAPVAGQVPLPAALPLFAGGLGAMALLARRRKQRQAAA